jgi:hypothetical protein
METLMMTSLVTGETHSLTAPVGVLGSEVSVLVFEAKTGKVIAKLLMPSNALKDRATVYHNHGWSVRVESTMEVL